MNSFTITTQKRQCQSCRLVYEIMLTISFIESAQIAHWDKDKKLTTLNTIFW